jgi:pimeloyl-ACP methyl ester carboxylesterase
MVIRGRIGSCPGEEPVKRLLVVLVAAALAVSLAGFDGGANASPAAPKVAVAKAAGTLSPWTACGTGVTCSRLTVPLDYANLAAGNVELAVTRRVHTVGSGKGLMMTNPGGPGASGTGLVALADYVPGGVGRQYDWIGFDPRGVGASVPALTCNTHFFGVNRPSFVPTTKRLMRFWKAKTRRYAAQCGASAAARAGLLAHMSTMDSVLDMESLRAALEVDDPSVGGKLNFYGFSYGSYLGQVYATVYPERVGRFVLDGVVNPTDYWYGANLKQEKGFDRNLNVFFAWVARHPRTYHLGRDWRAIRRGYQHLLKTLDRHPAYHRKLGPDELTDAIINAPYYVYQWDYIASAYSKLVRRGQGRAMFGLYRDSNMGDDNGYAVYLGVQCSDALRPPWRKQVRDAWRIHRKHPYLAWDNTWFNAPCVHWPAPSYNRLAVDGTGTATQGGKVLLVNETLDAATPYSGALKVRSLFPSSALIAGVGGTTHAGSLSGVSCVDDRIAAFLADGVLPTRQAGNRADVRCPKVPPPAVSSGRYAGSDRSTGPGLPQALRDLLLGAQRVSLG